MMSTVLHTALAAALCFALTALHPNRAFAGAVGLDDGGTSIDLPGLSPTTQPPLEPGGISPIQKGADLLASFGGSAKTKCAKGVLAEMAASTTKGVKGEELWAANSGMKAFNQLSLAKSPCRAILTEKFYAAVREPNQKAPKRTPDRLNGGRPALNAEAGAGSFAGTEAGFAYQEALRISGGNKALAMSMIGFCGHDDQKNQTPLIVELGGPSKLAVLRYLDARKVQASPVEGSDLEAFNRLRDAVQNSGRAELNINCPPIWSAFYAPKSLGSDADIPPSLKKEIADIQAPKEGPGALPAKYYHTIFGSVAGCRLASVCGLTPDEATKELGILASLYRNTRLKEQSVKYDTLRDLIEKKFGLRWTDDSAAQSKSDEILDWMAGPGKQELQDKGLSELLADSRKKMDWEALRTSIDTAMYHLRSPGSASCFEGLSKDRCDSALQKAKTHDIDLTWTKTQQELGAKFGAAQCRTSQPAEDGESLENKACEQLDRLNKQVGSGSSVGETSAGSAPVEPQTGPR